MTGLVVEGGASRTYFAVGVMDAMMEAGIKVNYLGGASARISNAMNYATGQIGRGLIIGTTQVPKKEYSGLKHLVNPKNRSLYNIDYVFRRVPDELVPYDYDKFEKFEGVAEATVTNVDTGRAEYIKIQNPQKGWDILVASCSLPLMFPIATIDGKRYMDGGIADSLPFERAFEAGCDKVIVILSRERDYVKKPGGGEKLSARIFRKYPGFSDALKNRSVMYNAQRKRLFELEKEGRVFVIAPDNTSDWKRTENRSEKIKEMYDEGMKKGSDCISRIKEFTGAEV